MKKTPPFGEEETRAHRHGCEFLSKQRNDKQVISENVLFKAACSFTLKGDFQLMCVMAHIETVPGSQGGVACFRDKIGCTSSAC